MLEKNDPWKLTIVNVCDVDRDVWWIHLWRSRWHFESRQVSLLQLFISRLLMYFRKHVALITRFCKFPPIKKYKKYHQIRAETESQNLRNRGNSWKTHLKNLISVRWDSYQKHNMEQIAGGWWSWDVQRGLFVVFKENTFTTGCPKCWTFAILAWRFGILDPPWIPRNSQFGALFFFSGNFRMATRTETVFCGGIPKLLWHVQSPNRIATAWLKPNDWLAQTRKVRKIQGQAAKPEEWRIAILVGMRVDIKSEISLNRKLLFLVSAVVWLVVHDGFASIYQRTNASTTLPH